VGRLAARKIALARAVKAERAGRGAKSRERSFKKRLRPLVTRSE
jgi:hypothetical protein